MHFLRSYISNSKPHTISTYISSKKNNMCRYVYICIYICKIMWLNVINLAVVKKKEGKSKINYCPSHSIERTNSKNIKQ